MKNKILRSSVTDRFCIAVTNGTATYECKVDEITEDSDKYYHLDVLSPYVRDMHDHIRQEVFHIEMHIDCDTGQYRIKTFNRKLPDELSKIEQQLSDALCAKQ